YVRSTQRGSLDHIDPSGFSERQGSLWTAPWPAGTFELVEPLFSGAEAGVTLFRSLEQTSTPMGKRLLRAWMLRPSIDVGEIRERLDAVEELTRQTIAREELRRGLEGVLDL